MMHALAAIALPFASVALWACITRAVLMLGGAL